MTNSQDKHRTFLSARSRVEALYEQLPYLEAYTAHTDLRVQEDPKAAIGGLYEELGLLQFEFLKRRDLEQTSTLLDIGCGTLRGGLHFIRHLNSGNYFGFDLSRAVIEHASRLILSDGLSLKKPVLAVNEAQDLTFGLCAGRRFDFLIAQSVFTHLMPVHVEECFSNLNVVMKPDSRFFFTIHLGAETERTGLKRFTYTLEFFRQLGELHCLEITDWSRHYTHPRGQVMLEASFRTD
ncbi:MAG: methyltransferase domain-containing protein [Methylomarinum sp.]|nr:methyltransferase domain-containing protein [Methylomarinum sp.]